jgi:hypothetical protein
MLCIVPSGGQLTVSLRMASNHNKSSWTFFEYLWMILFLPSTAYSLLLIGCHSHSICRLASAISPLSFSSGACAHTCALGIWTRQFKETEPRRRLQRFFWTKGVADSSKKISSKKELSQKIKRETQVEWQQEMLLLEITATEEYNTED